MINTLVEVLANELKRAGVVDAVAAPEIAQERVCYPVTR